MSGNPRVVYAVAGGEYSDFCCYGIFSTREKAEAWMDTNFTSEELNPRSVSEIELDEGSKWGVFGC